MTSALKSPIQDQPMSLLTSSPDTNGYFMNSEHLSNIDERNVYGRHNRRKSSTHHGSTTIRSKRKHSFINCLY